MKAYISNVIDPAELVQDALQAAHDIRSPVMALQALFCSIEEIDERKKKLAFNAVERVQEIAESLMSKYREKKERHELDLDDKKLADVVEHVATEKRFLLPPEIEIRTSLSRDVVMMVTPAQARELKRILSNIINNSVEAIYKKSHSGIISIKLYSSEGKKVISIQDNGCGIPKDILEKIGRAGYTYNKKNGHGLGLCRAKYFMGRWKGQLMVESVQDQYARVTMVF